MVLVFLYFYRLCVSVYSQFLDVVCAVGAEKFCKARIVQLAEKEGNWIIVEPLDFINLVSAKICVLSENALNQAQDVCWIVGD